MGKGGRNLKKILFLAITILVLDLVLARFLKIALNKGILVFVIYSSMLPLEILTEEINCDRIVLELVRLAMLVNPLTNHKHRSF